MSTDPSAPPPSPAPALLGSWARVEEFTGVVVSVADDQVALFDPGARKVTHATPSDLTLLPAGAVSMTISVEVPVPHGLGEDVLRRWAAALTDPVLRESAGNALRDGGLDDGVALPLVQVELTPAAPVGHLCVAGHRTPTEGDEPVPCGECGRAAYGQPRGER